MAWTPRRLTALIGVPGVVASVETHTEDRPWSRVTRLRLTWEPAGAGPAALVAKRVAVGRFEGGASEVDYYRRDYVGQPGAPLPRCYLAEIRGDTYEILLEDVSATHASGFEVAPSRAHAAAVAQSLARLHAPHVGVASRPHEAARFVSRCREGLTHALSEVTPQRAQVLTTCFGTLSEQLHARLEGGPCTLLHGDPSPGNVLYPRGPGQALLIDRQPLAHSMQVGPGGWDLALLMAQHWHAEERRALQGLVLQAYTAERARLGAPVDPDQLRTDYLLGVWITVANAVEWLADETDRTEQRQLWEMFLDRTLAAWFELGLPHAP